MILLSMTFMCYSQNIMNKNKIYSYWLKTKDYQVRSSENIYMLDSAIISIIDSLKAMGVDTIGLYNLDFIKYGRFHTGGSWDWVAYIQWISNCKTFNRKITKYHISNEEIIDSSVIIKYYIDNKDVIKNEQIMPVITGASINEKEDTLFSIEGIANSKYHTIYCYLSGDSKFTRFDQYELDNKNNVFYLDNKNSKINRWVELIQNQINSIIK